jgi:hypothetical protein
MWPKKKYSQQACKKEHARAGFARKEHARVGYAGREHAYANML